jgi:hypothetical protein
MVPRDLKGTDGDRNDQAGQHDTDQADNEGRHPGERMGGSKIAISDRQTGDECEIQRLADGPIFEIPDENPKSELNGYQTGKDRPYDPDLEPDSSQEAPPHFGLSSQFFNSGIWEGATELAAASKAFVRFTSALSGGSSSPPAATV